MNLPYVGDMSPPGLFDFLAEVGLSGFKQPLI